MRERTPPPQDAQTPRRQVGQEDLAPRRLGVSPFWDVISRRLHGLEVIPGQRGNRLGRLRPACGVDRPRPEGGGGDPVAERHLGLTLEKDKGMRVTNMVRHPDFINYVILARFDQPLTLTLQDRKLLMQVIPFENRRRIVVTHDVTEADRIDRLRRDFIANVSHELRTPLTSIQGYAHNPGWR